MTTVCDAAVGVNDDVGFHVKVPLVTLVDLMHLGVSLAVFVLGPTQGFDDGGIDDRTGLKHELTGS